MAMISVIIPVFNHVEELDACLKSLEQQIFRDFEVIVVDDGSTDNVQMRFSEYSAFFSYQFIRLDKNQGAPVARNRGFTAAQGEFLIFLDADIELVPTMLEELKRGLDQHLEADFAYSSFYFGRKLFQGYLFDVQRLKKMNFIHTSALIRREAFPGFDPSLKKFQDWDLWLTMAEQGRRGLFVDRVLFTIKPRKTGYSQWLPRFVYLLPWPIFGWMPSVIQRYRDAEMIIRKKHHL